MSSLTKIFEKDTPNGLVELFLESYCGNWHISVVVAGKRMALNDPCRLTDADRRRRKLPHDAALSIGFAVFREPDATTIEKAFAQAKADAQTATDRAAAEAEPIGYVYEVGCDTSDTYRVLWDESLSSAVREAAEGRLGTDRIRKNLHAKDFQAIGEATGAAAIPVNLGIYWGFRFDRTGLDSLLALASERQAAKDEAKAAKVAGADAGRAAKFAEAKATGKPVVLGRWVEDCDGSVEECSTDICVRMAMPDGKTKTGRTHSF